MRPLLALLVLTGFALSANAQVLRCVDAEGAVSYTDQRCPPRTRQAEQLLGPEATAPQPQREVPTPPPPVAEAARTPPPAPSAPGGLIVIDPRGAERAEAQQREQERQRRDAEYAADGAGYPYPAYPGYGRPPARQRDMRPRIQNCDAGGCQDTLGNRYDNTGRLDSYRGLDGRTCQRVGTTSVCR